MDYMKKLVFHGNGDDSDDTITIEEILEWLEASK